MGTLSLAGAQASGRQLEERLAADSRWQETGFIFCAKHMKTPTYGQSSSTRKHSRPRDGKGLGASPANPARAEVRLPQATNGQLAVDYLDRVELQQSFDEDRGGVVLTAPEGATTVSFCVAADELDLPMIDESILSAAQKAP